MKQVLDIEQMQHLKELGVDVSKATFGLFPEQIDVTDDGFPIYAEEQCAVYERNAESDFNYPTFTLQDILDLLPTKIEGYRLEFDKHKVSYFDYMNERTKKLTRKQNLIDAAYEMLCWCIENGYIT